ncbi:hypothetical protein Tco_0523071 [Tanacetum coccineum]
MLEEKVPSFLPIDDPLKRINKAMALFRSAITSRYPPVTIQEGKVDIGKALDVNLVVTKSSETELEKQDTRGWVEWERDGAREEIGAKRPFDVASGCPNDADADNADIRPIYDEEPMVEVGFQHTEQCQVKSPMLDSSLDNKTTEFSSQSLESENILLKKTVAQSQKDFSRTEAHSQIQEKIFAIDALKNDLRKLRGNSVNTKFAKTSVLGKPVLQSLRNQSVVRQPNAFKSERPQMSKPRFASQVDVNHNLSRPVTQHYFPKRSESAFSKPNHMIASRSSKNSSKNLPKFSTNDMVHNHYLDEARKKTQERDRNSKTSVMPSAKFQSTADDSKPKPRSTNHSTRSLLVSKSSCVTKMAVPIADHSKNSNSFSDSKRFVCSTYHKCVFNENHDACITNFLKEVNSRAKIQSNKTRNSNKPVKQKHHTQKPVRQIFIGHRFSPNKTSVVYEKTSPRSDLRWKPTGRIFKTVGLRWVSTGKILASCTSKDDSEPTHGSNVNILNIYECKQTLDLSTGTSINVQKEQSFDLSAGTSNNVKPDNLRAWLLKKLISHKPVLKWIHN